MSISNDSAYELETSRRPILVVEDSDEDFFTLQRAMTKAGVANPVVRFTRGEPALERLRNDRDLAATAFVVLDLNLPGLDGRDVLAILKADSRLRTIPVVVLTTSDNPLDVESCYRTGVNSYHLKVVDFGEFLETVRTIASYWLDSAVLPSAGGETH